MRSLTKRRMLATVSAAGIAGLALAGCTATTDSGTGDTDCSAYEQYGTFDGESVELYTTIQGVELDQLVESIVDFETCTGITVDTVGTQEAETQINVRAAAGDAPELMIIPQPGLLQRLAQQKFDLGVDAAQLVIGWAARSPHSTTSKLPTIVALRSSSNSTRPSSAILSS